MKKQNYKIVQLLPLSGEWRMLHQIWSEKKQDTTYSYIHLVVCWALIEFEDGKTAVHGVVVPEESNPLKIVIPYGEGDDEEQVWVSYMPASAVSEEPTR